MKTLSRQRPRRRTGLELPPRTGHLSIAGAHPRLQRVYRGREAILAHIYGADPVPITRIIVFRIGRTAGTFGTVLSG